MIGKESDGSEDQWIFFRVGTLIQPWGIRRSEPLRLTYTNQYKTTVNDDDSLFGGGHTGIINQVAELPVDPRTHAELERIVDRASGAPRKPNVSLKKDQAEHPDAYMEHLPAAAASIISSALGVLTQDARRIVKLITWRADSEGSPNPFIASTEFDWSLDSQNWLRLTPAPPNTISGTLTSEGSTLSRAAMNEIEQLLSGPEPILLGQQLYREAWLGRKSSPRSAVIVGVAAAEAGVKDYLSGLSEDTKWLFENIPSPPLNDLLRTYLPDMLARHKIRQDVPCLLPAKLLKTIQRGIEVRNKLVHIGKLTERVRKNWKIPDLDPVLSLQPEDLEEILLTVHDLLYLLDFYSGVDWALGNLRSDTISQLERKY